MKPSDAQRAAIGRAVASARVTQYGTKRAAYQAAKINSATWDNIESGLPVRDDRLAAVVEFFWPDTGGDWTRLDLVEQGSVGGSTQDATSYVNAPGAKVESGVSNEDLLREILRSRAEYDQLRAEVRELSGRVERIERDS